MIPDLASTIRSTENAIDETFGSFVEIAGFENTHRTVDIDVIVIHEERCEENIQHKAHCGH